MKFIDFTDAQVGLLVKRSAHHRAQLAMPDEAQDILGIVTGREFFEEAGRVVCYPVVHWEGTASASICHPVNVAPARLHALPVIVVDDGCDVPAPSRPKGRL